MAPEIIRLPLVQNSVLVPTTGTETRPPSNHHVLSTSSIRNQPFGSLVLHELHKIKTKAPKKQIFFEKSWRWGLAQSTAECGITGILDLP